MSDGHVFEIGGVEYDVVKRGISQARQVSGATRFLSRYGTPAFKKLSGGDLSTMSGFEVMLSVVGELDENALIELFQLVFGVKRDDAEEHFDVNLLIDGLVAMYNYSPAIRKLADRFFSPVSSELPVEESSMPSEPPTAG